ncbi:MAG TPA: hypothetical protein VJM31_14985 [Vicinamibacterales bacterium]|nr:hypothetical protein [Vicinamibacterales bacterium]
MPSRTQVSAVLPHSRATGFRRERNLDLGVTTRCRGSNGYSDLVGILSDAGPPSGASQNHKGDAAPAQVLLVANAAVRRKQQLEPRFFGRA